MKLLYLLFLFLLAPGTTFAAGSELSVSCHQPGIKVNLQARSGGYELRVNDSSAWQAEAEYQDEEMVMLRMDGVAYQFVNLLGCVDANGAETETLLVISDPISEKILRPHSAFSCSCRYQTAQ